MKALNPTGEFLFMHKGKPLTTDSFNRRLKKYCIDSGIPYLSSHKIRFTGASMLYNAGVKTVDIQPLLGHSTLVMTEHYIGQKVDNTNINQMSEILNYWAVQNCTTLLKKENCLKHPVHKVFEAINECRRPESNRFKQSQILIERGFEDFITV